MANSIFNRKIAAPAYRCLLLLLSCFWVGLPVAAEEVAPSLYVPGESPISPKRGDVWDRLPVTVFVSETGRDPEEKFLVSPPKGGGTATPVLPTAATENPTAPAAKKTAQPEKSGLTPTAKAATKDQRSPTGSSAGKRAAVASKKPAVQKQKGRLDGSRHVSSEQPNSKSPKKSPKKTKGKLSGWKSL
jgi:hypothetical protein